MHLVQLVGYLATILTVSIYLPQTIKTWKTRHTKDLSLPMYILAVLASITWVVYGVLLKNTPLILTNSIVLIFSGVTLLLILKNRK